MIVSLRSRVDPSLHLRWVNKEVKWSWSFLTGGCKFFIHDYVVLTLDPGDNLPRYQVSTRIKNLITVNKGEKTVLYPQYKNY